MTDNSQSHQFKLLLENKFAGVILWNKNKILTHMNDNVKEFGISGKRFKIGYCWCIIMYYKGSKCIITNFSRR